MGCNLSQISSSAENPIKICYDFSRIQNSHIFCNECKKNNADSFTQPIRTGHTFDNVSKENLWICYKCSNGHTFAVYVSQNVLLDSYEYCSKNNIISGLKYGIISH